MQVRFDVPKQFFLQGIPCRVDLHQGQRIGDYVVDKILGSGAFGDVYKVDQNGISFALKILKLWEVVYKEQKELVGDRFLHEFHAARTQSDYLVHTHAFGEIENNPFFIMDYIPDGDLRGHLGKLSMEQMLKVGMDSLKGLRDLHAEGIIHRDIKPDNVLLKGDGNALLTDFGVSAFVNHHIKRCTRPNMFGHVRETFGTYAYIAPEQLVASKKYAATTPRTDIWSWGVMMYELFSGGFYPWGTLESESDLVEFIKNANTGRFVHQSAFTAIPDSWAEVIMGALQPKMNNRFENIQILLRIIEQSTCTPVASTIADHQKLMLRVLQGVEHDRIYALTPDKETYNIGRGNANEIQLMDFSTTFMSRYHATIQRIPTQAGWFIRDGQWSDEDHAWLPSTNGTYLNSSPVDPLHGAQLSEGDLIIIGDTTLRVEKSE